MEKKKTFFQKLFVFVFGEIIVVQHPFWGELVDAGDYYEGKKFFAPINQQVEFGLDKTTSELEKKQIAFFRNIEENYATLISAISPTLERRVCDWIPGYRIKDFEKEFLLEYLRIQDFSREPYEWGISFYADNDLQHWCSLEMKGMEVGDIMIDG